MPFHKKISRLVRKAIPKEIAPFVAPVAGMALGPMAGSFLGGLGGTLAAKGGISAALGNLLSKQMVSQGLGRALVDVGTQALTSDRISPASALLSGGLGALSGYQQGAEGFKPNELGGKGSFGIRRGSALDKAFMQGKRLGSVGNLDSPSFDLLGAAKTANIGGTLKAADDELAAEKKRQAVARAKNEAFFEADNAGRRQSIIESMMLAGFTRLEGEQAAAEEGYAFGGRVGFATGGGTEDDRDEIAFGLFGKPYKELNADELDELREEMERLRQKFNNGGIPMVGPPMMADNVEDMGSERMDRLGADKFVSSGDTMKILNFLEDKGLDDYQPDLSEYIENGKGSDPFFDSILGLQFKDGGKVPGLPAGRQVDAREGTFIPMGGAKRADDVPAMLSVNEFVLNDDAVAGLGKMMTGRPDPRAGARALYKIQDQLEAMV